MVAPTDAPVAAPTSSPVVAPTEAPVVAPTQAPVVAPTSSPVVAPTGSPVVAPTNAPVVAPTDAPVATPTSSPVVARTGAPVVAPTKAPVAAPTNAPVVAPTEAPVAAPTNAPVVAPTDTPLVAEDESPVAVPTDLLVNGGFEDFPTVTRWRALDAVGWSSLNGNKLEIWASGFSRTNAHSGKHLMELDYRGGSRTAVDGIFQDIQTVDGQEYQLTFYMQARRTSNSAEEAVYVEWNGTIVGPSNGYRAPRGRWTEQTAIVTGTGGLDRLLLRENNNSGNGRGPLLDDVSLLAII